MIESNLDPGRGPVVTVLVQRGTLNVGDAAVSGPQWGRVRAMHDFTGARVEQATPGMPVEVLGFEGVVDAGERVEVVENDRTARQIAGEREHRLKTEALARRQARKLSLDEVLAKAREGELNELNLVIKGDVSGSLEALEDEIAKVPQSEVPVNIIHSAPGGINESDVMLAAASDAIIIGFNVRPLSEARRVAEDEGVDIRTYDVIYKVTEDLRAALEGMLEPEEVEETDRRGRGAADLPRLARRQHRRLRRQGGQGHQRRRGPPDPRGHGRLDRAASARCAASRTTSRRSRRASSAASCSTATPTSRSGTCWSSSAPSRWRRRWSKTRRRLVAAAGWLVRCCDCWPSIAWCRGIDLEPAA